MTPNELDQVAARPVSTAGFVGQGTAIEQSRAVAEVQAAIYVAQQMPRDVQGALTAMHETTALKALAERAFFSYNRGGQNVSGPTIHLARELARVWGNVQYGIAELRRDDDAGLSEMQAFAWDVQTNTRAATIFIVPHRRDTRQGVKALVELRDVYENNANMGARRLREQIFAILPRWLTDDAIERCRATLAGAGDSKPLPQRINDSVRAYDDLGVSIEQLEAFVNRPRARWTANDVSELGITFRSLQRGERRVDEAFPNAVSVNEITGEVTPGPQQTPASVPPANPTGPDPWEQPDAVRRPPADQNGDNR